MATTVQLMIDCADPQALAQLPQGVSRRWRTWWPAGH